MDVGQWKSALARREELPLDLRDAIRMYPEVSSICCKRHCYGILLLFLALKMPTARSVFLRCWKEQGCEATVAVVFETLSAFATAMSMCPMEEETRDIGGPLYVGKYCYGSCVSLVNQEMAKFYIWAMVRPVCVFRT